MSSTGELIDHAPEPEPMREVPVEELRWHCPPLTASKAPPKVTELLGQDRPLQALQTGLELWAPGYHVFVSGLIGTGRMLLVKALLEELRPRGEPGPDRVYLNNFREPPSPRLLTLPRGDGDAFQRGMEDLVLSLQDALQAAIGSRPHKMSRRLVVQNADERKRRLMDAMSREAEKQGCSSVQYETQPGALAADIYPVLGGQALSPQVLAEMVSQGDLTTVERDELLARREALLERLEEVYERIRRYGRRTEQELRRMDRRVAEQIVETHFREFTERWPQPQVAEYLDEVGEFVARDLDRWVAVDEDHEAGVAEHSAMEPTSGARSLAHTALHELGAHVVHANSGTRRPVIAETSPTFSSLFGTIEPPRDGQPPGLAMIHAGALLRADGGYLVLRAADVLSEPGVWGQLKRALKTGKLAIREFDPSSGTTVGSLQPEAIPIDIKVVLIGEPGIYEQLAAEDPQFLQTFKVHAEFDTTVPSDDDNLRRYADFLAFLTRDEGLQPFSPEAAAAVAEFGARLAGRRDRLTTRFGEIADLSREASLACVRAGVDAVRREHVRDAWLARRHRLDLAREQIQRDLRDGYLLIRTEGRAVGQINSLTVVDTGTFAFGKPGRITVSTGIALKGRSRVVNIERESDLSGPVHDKGVMILAGYMLDRFAQDGVLALQAAVCFEQNYGGVDGDSASSAELYALLSSLAKVPLHQGIGVTGSVNQKGEIQAVSAVNEKIEGFFRTCSEFGLTGDQGVMIPSVNIPDLMLDDEVLEAVRQGQFRVWSIDRIDQGLRILTGMDPDEVMQRVAATLDRFRGASD